MSRSRVFGMCLGLAAAVGWSGSAGALPAPRPVTAPHHHGHHLHQALKDLQDFLPQWQSLGSSVKNTGSMGFNDVMQLGGKATFDWRPDGLSCVLRVPHQQPAATRSDTVINLPDGAASRGLPSQRIMIVEDEALVAMILEDQLGELGISIVATCASVPEAMKAIEKNAPAAAILDVNLGGQLVYPVADRLIDRGIPFVFVTGYGRESVDQRYSFVKVLEKPVERQALEGLPPHQPLRFLALR